LRVTGKRPRSSHRPRGTKTPKQGESHRNFKWSFDQAELDDVPWNWKAIPMRKFLKEVLKKLKDFETMTWPEIEGRNSHFVLVNELSKNAQQRLAELNLEPVKLFSLRLTGRGESVGISGKNILYILWWDPKHTAYPAEKKHT